MKKLLVTILLVVSIVDYAQNTTIFDAGKHQFWCPDTNREQLIAPNFETNQQSFSITIELVDSTDPRDKLTVNESICGELDLYCDLSTNKQTLKISPFEFSPMNSVTINRVITESVKFSGTKGTKKFKISMTPLGTSNEITTYAYISPLTEITSSAQDNIYCEGIPFTLTANVDASLAPEIVNKFDWDKITWRKTNNNIWGGKGRSIEDELNFGADYTIKLECGNNGEEITYDKVTMASNGGLSLPYRLTLNACRIDDQTIKFSNYFQDISENRINNLQQYVQNLDGNGSTVKVKSYKIDVGIEMDALPDTYSTTSNGLDLTVYAKRDNASCPRPFFVEIIVLPEIVVPTSIEFSTCSTTNSAPIIGVFDTRKELNGNLVSLDEYLTNERTDLSVYYVNANGDTITTNLFPENYTTEDTEITAIIKYKNTGLDCAEKRVPIKFTLREQFSRAIPTIYACVGENSIGRIITIDSKVADPDRLDESNRPKRVPLKDYLTYDPVTESNLPFSIEYEIDGNPAVAALPETLTAVPVTITAILTSLVSAGCAPQRVNINFEAITPLRISPTLNLSYNGCIYDINTPVTFDTVSLETDIRNAITSANANPADYNISYTDSLGNDILDETTSLAISSPFPASFKTSLSEIKAKITKKNSGNCSTDLRIILNSNTVPSPVTNDPAYEITQCSTTSDTDVATFDTRALKDLLLNRSANLFEAKYENNEGKVLINGLPDNFVTGNQTIKAIVRNRKYDICTTETTIKFTVHKLPPAVTDTNLLNPTACSATEIATFDIQALQNALIGNDSSLFEVSYTNPLTGDPIADANGNEILGSMPNSFTTGYQKIKATVKNRQSNSCSRDTVITFSVTTNPPDMQPITLYSSCSDNNTFTFDTSNIESSLMDTNLRNNFNIKYTTELGAPIRIDQNNTITGAFPPTFTTNTSVFVIIATAENILPVSPKCQKIARITLNGLSFPKANELTFLTCSTDTTAANLFDISQTAINGNEITLESYLTENNPDITIKYQNFMNIDLVDTNGFAVTQLQNPYSTTDTVLYAVLKTTPNLPDTTVCTKIVRLNFKVNHKPSRPATIRKFICDTDNDGSAFANLTALTDSLVTNRATETVAFYSDRNTTALITNPNQYESQGGVVYAVVSNRFCSSDTATIELRVANIQSNINNVKPKIICNNNTAAFPMTIVAEITRVLPGLTYAWQQDGVTILGKNQPSLMIDKGGIYTLEIKDLDTGCSGIQTFEIINSIQPDIKPEDIVIVDLGDKNSITINSNAVGNYEYSLDNEDGPYQDSNFFDQVPAGIHTVYVRDKNGCNQKDQEEIAVLGLPKFFSPNGDGYNDFWEVKGANADFYRDSIIYIYDRYGKLLKQLVPSSGKGWDGTINGEAMPGGEYWYTVKFSNRKQFKGHFSLKK